MQYILVSLLFLLLGIFSYTLFLHERDIEKENRNFFIGLFALGAILICKQFPIPNFFGGVFDFKYIPFLLGGIYGGRYVAYALFIGLTAFNFYFGDEHYVSNLVISGLMLITIVYFLLPKFHLFSKKKKIFYLMIVLFFYSCLTIVVNVGLIKEVIANLGLFVMFGIVQAISIGMIVLISEYIRESTIIKAEYIEAEKLRVVSQLAASVSHEVRNPLTVTRGFIQLLDDPKLDQKKKVEFLNLSLQELDRAQEIITQYLTLAKPINRDHDALLHLSEEIDYITRVMNPFALLHDVEIIYQVHAECQIVGDLQKLRQCLMNLVKNAIEAMENGGKVTLTVDYHEEQVVISIRDTGVGMSKEQISLLGGAYQSTKDTGTGLGLMVVFNSIRAMGGKIEVESSEGVGTVFSLTFPKITEANHDYFNKNRIV